MHDIKKKNMVGMMKNICLSHPTRHEKVSIGTQNGKSFSDPFLVRCLIICHRYHCFAAANYGRNLYFFIIIS